MLDKLKTLVFISLLAFSVVVNAKEDECPFPGIYIEFDRSYHQCANGQVREGGSCKLFIEKIVKLLPKYNCKRSFDTEPVPAIWLFDVALEDYIKLLYELASGENSKFNDNWFEEEKIKAREIFLSAQFRSVLDGYMAEEYFPLIKRIRKNTP